MTTPDDPDDGSAASDLTELSHRRQQDQVEATLLARRRSRDEVQDTLLVSRPGGPDEGAEDTLLTRRRSRDEVRETGTAQRSSDIEITRIGKRSRRATLAEPGAYSGTTPGGTVSVVPDELVPAPTEPRRAPAQVLTVPEHLGVTAGGAAGHNPLPEVSRNRERRRAITVLSVAILVALGSAAGLVVLLLLWP